MPISLNNEMMRQIIMDHYQNPQHKSTPHEGYISIHSKSENCIDDINVYIKLEHNVVKDCLWDGAACAISTASTDIMCDLVINKNEIEAITIINEYLKMIHEEEFNGEILGEALAFIYTAKQAARIKCATIGCNAIKDLINEKK